MRENPSDKSEMVNQILFGEIYEILRADIKFSLVKLNHDGYQGWICNKQVTYIEEQEYTNLKNEILKPELRIYNQPNIVTSEADIKTNIFTDKFITMNLVQNEEYFNIRYQVKPFMLWIWVSVLLISAGGILSFFTRRIE